MKTIYIKNQKEFDKLPSKFNEYTHIIIKDTEETISVVVARENSNVVARENSNVVALDNSNVVARDNSKVVALDNSNVVAWDNVGVRLYSKFATVVLYMFAVCWELSKGKITKKSKTSTIIKPVYKKGVRGWLEKNAIENKTKIILYKKVSADFKTQENNKNETIWNIGKTLEHPDWSPKQSECGEGKFHACSRPYFCDEFRNEKGDRYIAIEIAKKDLYAWEEPTFPHKIAFKKGRVLKEVNKFGKDV